MLAVIWLAALDGVRFVFMSNWLVFLIDRINVQAKVLVLREHLLFCLCQLVTRILCDLLLNANEEYLEKLLIKFFTVELAKLVPPQIVRVVLIGQMVNVVHFLYEVILLEVLREDLGKLISSPGPSASAILLTHHLGLWI